MYDLKIYDTIQTYAKHYKGYMDDIHRHSPIDSIYLTEDKKHLIVSLTHEDFKLLRPESHKTIVIIHKDKFFLYYPYPSAHMVKPEHTHFDPKSNQLKFVKGKNPLWATWEFTIRADRFFGEHRPTKLTKINYNWFFDEQRKTINFVISSSPNAQD